MFAPSLTSTNATAATAASTQTNTDVYKRQNIISVSFGSPGNTTLGGQVTGGTLTKYGNGILLLAATNNNYAATIINEDATNTATSIVGSLTRTGTPFGTGPITVNPGAMLRIADPSNISGNLVTVLSDGRCV